MRENLSRGSFFRIVPDVMINGVSLGEIILNEDLATTYRPGSEAPWCA